MWRKSPDLLSAVDARRIAVIKPSALGDVVQALPLLPVLRQRFAQAHLAWVIQRELQDLVTGHPALDEVIVCERRPSWSAAVRFLSRLHRERFDLVLDLQGLLRTAVMTAATAAPLRIGLETAREGAGFAVNLVVPHTTRQVPAHQRYWNVAHALGCGEVRREVIVHVPETITTAVRNRMAGWPRPIVAVQSGAKWETKRWPLDRYAAVLAHTLEHHGGSVVLIGSRGERGDCKLLETMIRRQRPGAVIENLAGETSLKELAAVLQCVDLLLSNDSGPLHLAAELGTPTVGLFTCTSPVRSGPPGPLPILLASDVDCAASYHKTCPWFGDRHQQCFQGLTVDQVSSSVATALRRAPSDSLVRCAG